MKIDYPTLLLSLIAGRCIIFGAGIGDAIAVIGLAALFGFTKYLKTKEEQPINAQLKQELSEMKSSINALKLAKSLGR